MTHRLKKGRVYVDFRAKDGAVEVYAGNPARSCFNEVSCVAGDVGLYDEQRSFPVEKARRIWRDLLADGFVRVAL